MGWLPVDASRIAVLSCSAYKWLCSARGTAFMSVRPEVRERLTAHAAGWYAGDDPYSSYYGAPLRLGGGARRFDVSPAWFSWASTAPNRFRDGLGLPAGDSAIVSAELPEAEERLRGTRVMAVARSGLLRTSWHVYNTDEDVDELLELLD